MTDLRYATRRLLKNPGFTAVAVLTLALGIGANSAMFGLVNALLFRPPPGLGDVDRLVWVAGGDRIRAISFADYLDFRDDTRHVLSGLTAYAPASLALGSGGAPMNVAGQMVTRDYFDVLGARPAIGRGFLSDEEASAGPARVAVLGDALWRNRFGGDPNMIGETIVLNGHPFVVVGIAPVGFRGTAFGRPADVWVPVGTHDVALPRPYDVLARDAFPNFHVIGRLLDGVEVAHAETALRVIATRINPLEPERTEALRPIVSPVRGWWPIEAIGPSRLSYIALPAIVTVLVLLIVCANVGNLLLTRAVRRRRELGIRLALGAGRRHLVRQLLSESLLLALFGGVAGLLAGSWAMNAFQARFFFGPLVSLEASLDLNVLVFTGVAVGATALLCGLVPALRTSRPDLLTSIRADRVDSLRRPRLQSSLVVAQMALSLVLLVTAGLFIRKFQAIVTADPGFDAAHVLMMSFDLTAQGYSAEGPEAFHAELERRVRRLPGVVEATASSGARSLPRISRLDGSAAVPGGAASATSAVVAGTGVAPEYFRTLSMPILRGRGFSADENRSDAARVAVISESVARLLWPHGDALGARFSLGGESDEPVRVIGIVADAAVTGFDETARLNVYLPEMQYFRITRSTLLVRTTGDPLEWVDGIRAELRAMAPDLPIDEVQTLAQEVGSRIGVYRDISAVFAGFGALALALAALGLYGVVAFTVADRTREIGIRIALGAQRPRVLRQVLGDGVRLTLIGGALGALAAPAVGRIVASVVAGVEPIDPVTFATTAVLLVVVALLASYVPARRATRVDPMVALRHE